MIVILTWNKVIGITLLSVFSSVMILLFFHFYTDVNMSETSTNQHLVYILAFTNGQPIVSQNTKWCYLGSTCLSFYFSLRLTTVFKLWNMIISPRDVQPRLLWNSNTNHTSSILMNSSMFPSFLLTECKGWKSVRMSRHDRNQKRKALDLSISSASESKMASWCTFRASTTGSSFKWFLRGTQSFLFLALLASYPTSSTSISTRRINSRFLDLRFNDNYTRVYRALDEGMRDPRRLDAAFDSVDKGRALDVFDVARAIVPGEDVTLSCRGEDVSPS